MRNISMYNCIPTFIGALLLVGFVSLIQVAEQSATRYGWLLEEPNLERDA